MDTRACSPVPESLATYLTARPPLRDVARLAHAVVRLRGRHRHGIHGITDTPELFAEWCEKALSTLTDPQAAVDAIVDKATKAHERAFCYATALLEGARTDTVHAAARILMTATATPADPQPCWNRTARTTCSGPSRPTATGTVTPSLSRRCRKPSAVTSGATGRICGVSFSTAPHSYWHCPRSTSGNGRPPRGAWRN